VREYLAELEQVNPVSDAAKVSTTDPDAILTTKGGGTATMREQAVAGEQVSETVTENQTYIMMFVWFALARLERSTADRALLSAW
jgi:hypothetical protein